MENAVTGIVQSADGYMRIDLGTQSIHVSTDKPFPPLRKGNT